MVLFNFSPLRLPSKSRHGVLPTLGFVLRGGWVFFFSILFILRDFWDALSIPCLILYVLEIGNRLEVYLDFKLFS